MSYGNYAPFYRPGFFNPMQMPPVPNAQEGQNQYGQPFAQPFSQPNVQPFQPMQTQAQQQGSNGFLFVLNENEASSYPVAPNNAVMLWDRDNPTIYVKSVDAQGVPSLRILDFTERNATPRQKPQEHVCKCGDKYVSKEQYDELRAYYDDLMSKYQSLSEKIDSMVVKPAPKKKTEAENE